MNMIDIDKFICSLCENGYGTIGMGDIKYALKEQGFIYKDGKLQKLSNVEETGKNCEEEPVDIDAMVDAYEKRLVSQANGVAGSPLVTMCLTSYKHGLQDAISEQKLANSCESCKVEEWFMCKHDWKAIDNEIIFEKGKIYHISHPWLGNVINFTDYFRPATEEEINREVGNSDIPQRMVSAKVKEEGYSKSEEYDEIALRDGDDNGITIQVMADGRNVSDFRISKGQAHILKAELEAYICKF